MYKNATKTETLTWVYFNDSMFRGHVVRIGAASPIQLYSGDNCISGSNSTVEP